MEYLRESFQALSPMTMMTLTHLLQLDAPELIDFEETR
jgi:hypothetical protein